MQPITVYSIIFLATLTVQVILAIIALTERRRWGQKYDFLLSSDMDMVEMLAKFSRIEGAFPIKVDANIAQPAAIWDDTLALNKKAAYRKSFYYAFYTLRQLLILQRPGNSTVFWEMAQRMLYYMEILLAIFAQIFFTELLIIPIFLGLCCILLTMVIERKIDSLNSQALYLATDLLDMHPIEQGEAVKVVNNFVGEGFTYVLFPWRPILRFLLPKKTA